MKTQLHKGRVVTRQKPGGGDWLQGFPSLSCDLVWCLNTRQATFLRYALEVLLLFYFETQQHNHEARQRLLVDADDGRCGQDASRRLVGMFFRARLMTA